jgi:hypothetical protein
MIAPGASYAGHACRCEFDKLRRRRWTRALPRALLAAVVRVAAPATTPLVVLRPEEEEDEMLIF